MSEYINPVFERDLCKLVALVSQDRASLAVALGENVAREAKAASEGVDLRAPVPVDDTAWCARDIAGLSNAIEERGIEGNEEDSAVQVIVDAYDAKAATCAEYATDLDALRERSRGLDDLAEAVGVGGPEDLSVVEKATALLEGLKVEVSKLQAEVETLTAPAGQIEPKAGKTKPAAEEEF